MTRALLAIALAGLLPSCGGLVEPPRSDGGAAASPDGARAPSDAGADADAERPHESGCPDSPPSSGTRCSGASQCFYDGYTLRSDHPTCGALQADCEDGTTWGVFGLPPCASH